MSKNLLSKTVVHSWDHPVHWPDDKNPVERGCGTAYPRFPESFLRDYERIVGFASEHGLNVIGIRAFCVILTVG